MTALQDKLASNVTFVCPIWKMTARDGAVAAYCEHTRPLTFNSQLYSVAATETTRPLQRIGLQPNSVEIIGVFDEFVTRKDLELGRWKGAAVSWELVDYLNLGLGSTGRIDGFVGKVQPLNSTAYKLEILSKSDALQPLLGDLTSPVDRNSFPAGVDPAGFTFAAQVKQVTSARQFKVDYVQTENNYFQYGLVRFTSGQNNGKEMEVKTSTTTDSGTRTEVFLQLPMNGVVAVNDNVQLVAGYDGTREQLRTRFGVDAVKDGDFEPDLPGLKAVIKYPE